MGGSSSRKRKIIIVGLDNSGKSTLINSLKPQKVSSALTPAFRLGPGHSANSRVRDRTVHERLDRLHGVRHVWPGQVPSSVGVLLRSCRGQLFRVTVLVGDNLCGGLQRPLPHAGGKKRAPNSSRPS